MSPEEIEVVKNIRAFKNCSLKKAIQYYNQDKILKQINRAVNINDIKDILALMVTKKYWRE